ncbi:MAG: DUF1565 domain-containing protein [Candidatus Cloacimonetes bacterium]|nr:DUF1565 domain-containing protein [Candidatus Cloacimonadota bacterium]
MKKFLILVIVLLLISVLQGTTIEVDIEGNGDYTSIQEGIDASDEGDTVLVYPGRYYENVWIQERDDITLISLEALTGDSAYIDSTVIDGNRTGTCITVVYSSEITIQGFSITNGFEFHYSNFPQIECAGGLYFRNSEDIILNNCEIYENIGHSGGMVIESIFPITLSGLHIHNNYGLTGGGIGFCFESDITFNSENRCSIYNNFAGTGNDIRAFNSGDIYVVVDTFTVLEPDTYYCQYNNSDGYHFYYDINHAWQEEINEDLYVSTDGDDSNCGLSPAEPLKTIAVAMQRIESDSLNPKTVHLAEGIYSVSENEQIFPINIKPYVNLRGESIDTVIHNDGDFGGVLVIAEGSECEIDNLKLYNEAEYKRGGLIYSGFYVDATLKNLIMENYEAREDDKSPVQPPNHCYYHFENVIFRNNSSYNHSAAVWANTNIELTNCVFDNNINYNDYHPIADVYCFGDEYFRMTNCLFTNSHYIEGLEDDMNYIILAADNQDGWTIDITGCIFYNHSGNTRLYTFNSVYSTLNMINCTFYNSECDDIPIYNTCTTSNFYNNIFYLTTHDYQLYVKDNTWMGYPPTDINMSHNLIYGGESSIWTSPNNNLNWLEGNIDADPLLYEQAGEVGILDFVSVCRDAGTLDLPEGIILSDNDVYGHPRVYGDSLDIGAVEWIPLGHSGQQVSIDEDELPDSNDNMSIYPNPAFISEMRSPQLNIYWTGLNRSSESIVLEIFNIFGQKIYRRKINQELTGDNTILWDFRNKDGEMVPTGFYIVRLKTGNEYIMQKKLTVIK